MAQDFDWILRSLNVCWIFLMFPIATNIIYVTIWNWSRLLGQTVRKEWAEYCVTTFWTHSTYSSLLSHVLWTAIVLNSMGIIGHLSVLTSLLAKRFKRNIYLSYHWPRQYQTITFVLMKLLLCEHRHITLNFASQASPPPKKILIEWMNSEKTTNRIITLLHYSNY